MSGLVLNFVRDGGSLFDPLPKPTFLIDRSKTENTINFCVSVSGSFLLPVMSHLLVDSLVVIIPFSHRVLVLRLY